MKKILLIVALGLAAGTAGFIIFTKSNQPEAEPVASTDTPAASDAAPEPAPEVRPMATTLPDFSLKNRAGEMQSIQSWPGKSLIINFWATWCGPCRREIPLLMKVQTQHAKDGFEVIGIAIDFHDEVVKYADQMKMNYPLLIGEQDGMAAADSFGVNSMGLPFTVFTDNKGRIVTLHMGEITEPMSKIFLSNVSKVNSGELTPDSARALIADQIQALPPEKPAKG